MKYRKFGKLDWKVSALGFGAMRLPVLNQDHSNINEPESIKMIRYCHRSRVNYVDSGYFYHRGNSEVFLGKALQDGYREKSALQPNYHVRMYTGQKISTGCLMSN